MTSLLPAPYDDLLHQVATTYNLRVDLLRGQMRVESGGDPFAFRYEAHFFDRYILDHPDLPAAKYGPLAACSYGLLQIIYQVAVEVGYQDRPEGLFVPRVGLAFGAKKLRSLLDWAQGDYPKALSAYNGGQGMARGSAPYLNQGYVDKVYRSAGL